MGKGLQEYLEDLFVNLYGRVDSCALDVQLRLKQCSSLPTFYIESIARSNFALFQLAFSKQL